jgi:hypothetical protein
MKKQILCPIPVYYNVSTFVIVKYLHFAKKKVRIKRCLYINSYVIYGLNLEPFKYGIVRIQSECKSCIPEIPYFFSDQLLMKPIIPSLTPFTLA